MNVHILADCQSTQVGEGTYVWQFSVVLGNAVIGANCNINAHCFIENDVVLGDNVTVKCGNYLWDGLRVEDNVFIGSDCQAVAPVTFGRGSYVASGSTITENVEADALAIARSRQTNKPGYAKKLRQK